MTTDRGQGAAVFLDKDGTLIEDLPYNVDPRRIRLAPGAAYRLVVVTNQSGVARGYFSEADLAAVRDHLSAALRDLGVDLAGFYACPHGPEGGDDGPPACDCRKPMPGLVRRAAADLDLDLGRSWFIGDTWMDVAAGRQAGCRTALVGPDRRLAPEFTADRRPDVAVADLASAALAIVGSRPVTTSGDAG
jgi:histidinol-phosphate phosphatase family protein